MIMTKQLKNLHWNFWLIGVLLLSLFFSTPVLTVFLSSVFSSGLGESGIWQHLLDTVLKDYIQNSLWLMIGVAFGSLIIGVSTAWLTSVCEFRGRRIFQWSLLLPLAFPAYIIAYTYTGMLDFAGPVQTALRDVTGWTARDYWFPEIRSIGGAIIMFSLVLYPYVYLLARAAFLEQSTITLEASRSLGKGTWYSFFKVALPMARPAIIAGLSLALMETLADFGTVEYFGISTFTTGIYRTWFGLGDSGAAAQLSSLLLFFVLALLLLERWSRRQSKFYQQSGKKMQSKRIVLSGAHAWAAFFACLLPLLFGFLLPFFQLSIWSWETADEMINKEFFILAYHSLELALITAFLALVVALFMGYGKRLHGNRLMGSLIRMTSLGYAVPGTVIAVGVLIPFTWIDNTIDSFSREVFDYSTGLIFSGTLFALVFAYLVRFLSVSIGTVESALEKIKPSIDDACRSLGTGGFKMLAKVHLPIMRTSLLTALLLVFVDILKELPATLLLRPFNFNTLAVRAYELAADERLQDAASASIMIVLTGILPVLLLSYTISKNKS
ncbi:MAG: iron ABC transporter permease [Gammaproteobacteria bacterium]|nr:iron ABC transporter permease [Gammaproteobacteria bacterium]